MTTWEHPLLWIVIWIDNKPPSIKLVSEQWMKWNRSCLGFSFDGWCDEDDRAGCDVLPLELQAFTDPGASPSEQRSQDSMWTRQMSVQRIKLSSGQDPRSVEAIDLHL